MELLRLIFACVVVFGSLAVVPAMVFRAVSNFEVDRGVHWAFLAFAVTSLVHLKWGLGRACITGCLLICCICAVFSVVGITHGRNTRLDEKKSPIGNFVRLAVCFLTTAVAVIGVTGIYPSTRVSISEFAKGQSAAQAIRGLEWEWPAWLLGSSADPTTER